MQVSFLIFLNTWLSRIHSQRKMFYPIMSLETKAYKSFAEKNTWPWLISIWVSAIPCYMVLLLGWFVSTNIGKDNSFSKENAKHLKWVSFMALIDVVYYFAINGIFLLLDMSHPFVMGIALIICFCGTAFSVCAAALSHLVDKASVMKEENDLTI